MKTKFDEARTEKEWAEIAPDLLEWCVAQYHLLDVARVMLADYADLVKGHNPSVAATAKEISAELRVTKALLELEGKQ